MPTNTGHTPPSSATTLQINVVYDASGRRRRPRKVPLVRGRNPRRTWAVLGLLNLVAAGGSYYATWWRADPALIYPKLILYTPLPGVEVGTVARVFGPPAPRPADTRSTPVSRASSTTPVNELDTAAVVLWATAYGWLTLATIASCALALSAGALCGRAGGAVLRRIGTILTVGAVLALAFAMYHVWTKYARQYPPDHLRFGMGGLVFLCTMIGLMIGGGLRGLTRLASAAVILSATGSVIGLYLWAQCDAMPPEQSSITFLALVFIIHSLWGWILLPVTSRLRA